MIETKAVVTVSEMARMCGLSRARFYQLQTAGVFPPPLYDVSNRRPVYVEEMQKVCLEVRRRNCGVNGKPILFYARRLQLSPTPKPKKAKEHRDNYSDLVVSLQALGLTATSGQVGEAIKDLYPHGHNETDQASLIRKVFLHLKRQN